MEALDKGNTSCVMNSQDKINQDKYFVTLVSHVLKFVRSSEKDGKNPSSFCRNKQHER